MFEITPQDIAKLGGEQLRELIGRLCESELHGRGYSTVDVTWGGDQNAMDGGLDVRVDLDASKPIDGYIPRQSTGFQVKTSDMPASAIAAEMCPDGELPVQLSGNWERPAAPTSSSAHRVQSLTALWLAAGKLWPRRRRAWLGS